MRTREYIYALGNTVVTNAAGEWCFQQEQAAEKQVRARYELALQPEESVQLVIIDKPAPDLLKGEYTLRQLLAVADDQQFEKLARAAQVATWQYDHCYCPRCGSELEHHATDLAKQCGQCQLLQYPRLSPCVIMLIRNGDYCLLGHGHNFKPGVYSTLAGFIEVGETAEAAVAREVREETGIQIKNIEYFSSQAWPFPHSLMLGFTAEYAGGEIDLQAEELADAQWFHVDDLPLLPTAFSISRLLINNFIISCGREPNPE